MTALKVGAMVWDHGGEFGDNRTGGMVCRLEADANGETQVVVITDGYDNAKLRRPSLMVHHHDGRKGTHRPAYEDLGPVARLIRIPVADIDAGAASDFRSYAKVYEHARLALFAAAVAWLPDYRDDRSHDAFLTAYRDLRAVAQALEAGIAA
jgi:hypothetical protein